MPGFTYTLTLQEPVLANSLGGEPNSANSLFYIPGGLLRGAAIHAYAGKKDADDDTFRRLFLDGSVRYLNAYPLSKNGRSLPTPLKCKKPKYFSGSDLSTLTTNEVHALEETWQINVHTQRDAEAGHAKEEAGAVYRYIALPAGLILQGAILTTDQTDADKIEKLLKEKSILLGKARTAGYGTALVTTRPLDLKEGGVTLKGKVGKFTLTLRSPAIVRDEHGQPALDISTALKARLGISSLTIKETYQRAEIVGGFNRIWGLPLPQVTAIAAGSIFEIEANVDADKLTELKESGIGERRAEGFGRVTVNSASEINGDEQWLSVEPSSEDLSKTQITLIENKTAAVMLKRLVRKELDEKVIHIARLMTAGYQGKIPNSQLSRWRVIVRSVLEKKDKDNKRNLQTLKTFIEESKGKTGWKKMEKAKVTPSEGKFQRLTEWMEELVREPSNLYSVLKIKPDYQLALGDKNVFKMDDELNLEYRLRLLDAVLAVMAKMNGGNND